MLYQQILLFSMVKGMEVVEEATEGVVVEAKLVPEKNLSLMENLFATPGTTKNPNGTHTADGCKAQT